MCLGAESIIGMISSDLQIDPDQRVLDGWATVNVDGQAFVTITFTGGTATLLAGDTKVVIDGNLDGDQVLVNGEWRTGREVLRGFESNLINAGYEVLDWDEASQTVMALSLLHMTCHAAHPEAAVRVWTIECDLPGAQCGSVWSDFHTRLKPAKPNSVETRLQPRGSVRQRSV